MKMRVFEKNKGFLAQAIAFAMASFWVTACTSSNEDGGFAGGTTEDAGIIADLNVAGVTQKGPFAKGSAVAVQGIDCKTLKFTDETFEGSVKNDKGEFVVDNVTLSSTCAVFEVSGYYLNELTGKKSAKKLTLRALTNLKDRKNVNINVLTELEYERVMNLVAGLKKSFAEAKKQAEKEVLASFNIKGDFDEAEDLNAFEKGDGNAALLAVSVLTLATAGEAEVSERLEEYSTAIADNGSLDEDTKTEMTNWASAAAASGSLDTIRENIESWGYADSVPAFETYVKEFAEGVIPSSSSKAVIPDSVALSSDDHEKSSSSKGDSGTKAGMTSSSSVTSAGSVTSSSSTTIEDPRASYLNPNINYGEMTDPRDGQVYKTVKIGDQVWMAQNLNYDDSVKTPSLKENSWCYNDSSEYCEKYGRLYSWAAAKDVCPTGWHLPSEDELDDLIDSVARSASVGKSLQTKFWDSGTDAYGFSAIPAGRRDDSGWYTGESAAFWSSTAESKGYAFYMFIFASGNARLGVLSEKYGASVRCIQGEVIADSSSSGKDSLNFDWSIPKENYLNPNIHYDSLVDDRDGQVYKTVGIGSQVWMAQNLNYADSVQTPSLKGLIWCYGNDSAKCEAVGHLYSWSAAIDSVALANDPANPLICGRGKLCEMPTRVQGVCPNGWHLPDTTEWENLFAAVGGRSTASDVLRSSDGWYYNKNGTNAYGFTALPAGYGGDGCSFGGDTSNGFFWTATQTGEDDAYYVLLSVYNEGPRVTSEGKNFGLSIRCVKD
ncbi:fibrobacter succinogenes major paralogous domain-containing protein [uncultured Fibrobacter sp.]|uniref:fibrobacter succinogenes major paralogous domain-containing protein n=1 Tax=uncultured Fibrobacter sp. TaxID=261512 RepID=UPI0025F2CDE9|nr:fibrobacter succinogenes major paralogous domain-containing protein [uncultured Fibrobacter sp.]